MQGKLHRQLKCFPRTHGTSMQPCLGDAAVSLTNMYNFLSAYTKMTFSISPASRKMQELTKDSKSNQIKLIFENQVTLPGMIPILVGT